MKKRINLENTKKKHVKARDRALSGETDDHPPRKTLSRSRRLRQTLPVFQRTKRERERDAEKDTEERVEAGAVEPLAGERETSEVRGFHVLETQRGARRLRTFLVFWI